MSRERETILENFFRHEYSRVVAFLTRRFGVRYLELIEDGVQDALLKAVQAWQFGGPPDSPGSWILVVARNRVYNSLRRNNLLDQKIRRLIGDECRFMEEAVDARAEDDVPRFLFLCCLPDLKQRDQIALTLNLVFGFSAAEIAAAFVVPETTIAQRLVRGKRRLREHDGEVDLPGDEELPRRREAVLSVLYLVFNEGYYASHGDAVINHDLCVESIRLLQMLIENDSLDSPDARALLALQLLQTARFPARRDDYGNPLLLEEQDRSLWNGEIIAEGMRMLTTAATGHQLTRYHLLATISALHNTAPSFAQTDWNRIKEMYHELYAMEPTPIIALNYGISIAMSESYERGITFIKDMPHRTMLKNYYHYYSTLGSLYLENNEPINARKFLLKARELTSATVYRRFIDRKLALL